MVQLSFSKNPRWRRFAILDLQNMAITLKHLMQYLVRQEYSYLAKILRKPDNKTANIL